MQRLSAPGHLSVTRTIYSPWGRGQSWVGLAAVLPPLCRAGPRGRGPRSGLRDCLPQDRSAEGSATPGTRLPGAATPWGGCHCRCYPPGLQKWASGWLAKVLGSCRSELGGGAGAPCRPQHLPQLRVSASVCVGATGTQGPTLPLQRRRPTAHPCTGSPPGGVRTMVAACPRSGARRSPTRVSPGGQPALEVPSAGPWAGRHGARGPRGGGWGEGAPVSTYLA